MQIAVVATNATPLLVGARRNPVGTPKGMTELSRA
jgi:hypothetical protein